MMAPVYSDVYIVKEVLGVAGRISSHWQIVFSKTKYAILITWAGQRYRKRRKKGRNTPSWKMNLTILPVLGRGGYRRIKSISWWTARSGKGEGSEVCYPSKELQQTQVRYKKACYQLGQNEIWWKRGATDWGHSVSDSSERHDHRWGGGSC